MKALMSVVLVFFALNLAVAEKGKDYVPPQPKDRKNKQEAIRGLLREMKASQEAVQIQSIFVQQVLNANRQLTEIQKKEVTDMIEKELSVNNFENMLVAIYEKYFDDTDIKDLTLFYQSRIGKKFVQLQPQVARDIAQTGNDWGKAVFEKVNRKIQSYQGQNAPADQKSKPATKK